MDAGTDWVGSRYGWALDFDGSDDRCVTPLLFNIGTSAFTVAAWVNGKNLVQSSSIMTSRPAGFNPSTQGVTAIVVGNFITGGSGRQASFGVFDTTARYRSVIGPDIFTDNNFHHIAGTWDGLTARLFYDGQEVSTTLRAVGSNIIMQNTGTFTLAASIDGSSPLNGVLDDCRVYLRALTPSELRLAATEPGIGLQPERTSVFFGAQLFNAAWAKNSNQLISAWVI